MNLNAVIHFERKHIVFTDKQENMNSVVDK